MVLPIFLDSTTNPETKCFQYQGLRKSSLVRRHKILRSFLGYLGHVDARTQMALHNYYMVRQSAHLQAYIAETSL